MPTARHAQFERAFDPNITFRADTYPHWVAAKVWPAKSGIKLAVPRTV